MNLVDLFGSFTVEWVVMAGSVLILLVYEAYLFWLGRSSPLKVARTAHADIRARWVVAVMSRPGAEILVVQTIRNSVMAASFMASTAVIALTGTLTLSGLGNVGNPVWQKSVLSGLQISGILTATKLILLALIFFASFMFSTMGVRYFSHASYLITIEMGSEPGRRHALATRYLNRAGYQYSMGLRTFFLCIPILASLFNTWIMLPATVLLIVVLYQFDRIPAEWLGEKNDRRAHPIVSDNA